LSYLTAGLVNAMRREELFSRSGFYGFVLQSNVLLHREAVSAAVAAFEPVLAERPRDEAVAVLDLACGGWPVTVSEVMEAFPAYRFAYTGIDINPDQVALASAGFVFPDNVVEARVLEGNAWDLEGLDLAASYPLVYSGMNLHHGTPEEIRFLGLQLRRRLAPGGVFFSHDVYRPEGEPYLRRPAVIEGEASWLVDPARLEALGPSGVPAAAEEARKRPGWRTAYVEAMRRGLIGRGADPEGAESTARHMRSRDYPISTRELRAIMGGLGFRVTARRYDEGDGPLGPYVASCVVSAKAWHPVRLCRGAAC
jgi:SAM-dependent methyltransferase